MTKLSLIERIKADIREERLPVAQQLTQQWLSEFYQVSRIPIRDALQRLVTQGWLVAHGKKGVQIPPLNAAQAQELYLMRMPLECLALELAFEQLNYAILGQAEDILVQTRQQSELSALELGVLNWQFHLCLYQPCQRPILLQTLHQLHEQCERYIGFQSQQLNYHQRSETEHYQLLQALKDKELSRAREILATHISEAGEVLVKHLQ